MYILFIFNLFKSWNYIFNYKFIFKECPWTAAQMELRKLNIYKTPKDKAIIKSWSNTLILLKPCLFNLLKTFFITSKNFYVSPSIFTTQVIANVSKA